MMEVDYVYSFISDFWLFFVFLWKYRSKNLLWFKFCVVDDIIGKGCYVVVIGLKLENYEGIEWRIFFFW